VHQSFHFPQVKADQRPIISPAPHLYQMTDVFASGQKPVQPVPADRCRKWIRVDHHASATERTRSRSGKPAASGTTSRCNHYYAANMQKTRHCFFKFDVLYVPHAKYEDEEAYRKSGKSKTRSKSVCPRYQSFFYPRLRFAAWRKPRGSTGRA